MIQKPLDEGSEFTHRLQVVVRALMTGVTLVVIGGGIVSLEGRSRILWIVGLLCVWAFFMGLQQAMSLLSSHLESREQQLARVRSQYRNRHR